MTETGPDRRAAPASTVGDDGAHTDLRRLAPEDAPASARHTHRTVTWWQQIGHQRGVSRKAAVDRFGHLAPRVDPDGAPETAEVVLARAANPGWLVAVEHPRRRTAVAELFEDAAEVWELMSEHEWHQVRARMSRTAARQLTADRLESMWMDAQEKYGVFHAGTSGAHS